MVLTIAKPKIPVAYPKAEVEACLRDALIKEAKMQAELHGKRWPADAAVQGAIAIHVDSLLVVGILCRVEPSLGFELPASVVCAGGYSSVDQAVRHIMGGIEQEWHKQKGGEV